ncbi:MAG TPA: RcpC/CpaB family pilus assembly protein [Egibacteraceae bacterium]|nr:RcpC/CpaB family pilus assembly protein [Egibacteraceae bacterium]
MNRRVIGAITAVLLAGLGTLVLIVWVRAAEQRALAGEQVVEVFVVTQEIAKGTTSQELQDRVELTQVPAKVRAAGSVDRLSTLDGKVAAVELLPGEQLLSSRFTTPEALAVQAQVDIPEGLLQVTVSLAPERALGGQLRPGDTVGVLGSFEPFDTQIAEGEEPPKTPNSTHLILHKVLVTNIQGGGQGGAPMPLAEQDDDEDEGVRAAPASDLLITLAVEAPAVERVVFAAEHGTVWLAHEPATADEGGTQIQTRGTIYE